MECRLCKRPRVRPLYDVRGWCIERCETCGFVQVRDRPSSEDLDAIYSDSYFGGSKYEDDFAQRKENNKRLTLMQRALIPSGGRVLDAGCATGDFIKHASDDYEMWGLDYSPFAAEQARAANPTAADRIFAGPLETQEFRIGSFDAIVLWDVVEHLWDPVASVRHLKSWLKPGGALLMSTPNIGSMTARLTRKRWAFLTPPEHLGLFSERTMRALIEDQLGMQQEFCFSTGKWVNVGFLAYKLRRVFPAIPQRVVSGVRASLVGDKNVYVPTRDIQYVGARKVE